MIARPVLDRIGTYARSDSEALRTFGRSRLSALQQVMDDGTLNGFRPSWSETENAIANMFGLTSNDHFLCSEAHCWSRFFEPQITRGFEFFLNQGGCKIRLMRAVALLNAAADEAAYDVSEFVGASAVAESGRIDLVVELVRADRSKVAAVMEAKFGHKVTTGQLPKYRKFSASLADHVIRFVVAPTLSRNTRSSLKRNRDWRFVTWKAFLLRFQHFLPTEADNDDFKRFRRTVWLQSYAR